MEPIGYSFLISYFSLTVLAPYKKSYLTTHAVRTKELSSEGEEEFFPPKFRTDGSWQSHLLFAIKQEGINLNILKALFQCVNKDELIDLIQVKKLSIYTRRIWFFYEMLTKEQLPIQPMRSGNYDYALPPEEYFTIGEESSERIKRQRLINNMPGNADFCPIVRMTKKVKAGINKNLGAQISETLKNYPSELIYRASSFLYLKETKSSYAIERQTPTQKRVAAFMSILQQAGQIVTT